MSVRFFLSQESKGASALSQLQVSFQACLAYCHFPRPIRKCMHVLTYIPRQENVVLLEQNGIFSSSSYLLSYSGKFLYQQLLNMLGIDNPKSNI